MRLFAMLCFIATLPFTSLSQKPADKAEAVNITLQGHEIFNNSNLIGSYKNIFIDSGFSSVVVYSKGKARIAEATHADGDENWSISTPVDQNKMYLKWTREHSLELLFKFLVEKKYL